MACAAVSVIPTQEAVGIPTRLMISTPQRSVIARARGAWESASAGESDDWQESCGTRSPSQRDCDLDSVGTPTSTVPSLADTCEAGSLLSFSTPHGTCDKVMHSEGWRRGKALEGAWGTAHWAMDESTGNFFVVRSLTAALSPVGVRQARRGDTFSDASKLVEELAQWRDLKHPNLMSVLQISGYGDRLFLHMEAVSHGPLTRLLDEFGPLQDSMLQRATSDMVSAVSFLHSQNIAHGNIQAASFFVHDNFQLKLGGHFGGAELFNGQALSALDLASAALPWTAPEVARLRFRSAMVPLAWANGDSDSDISLTAGDAAADADAAAHEEQVEEHEQEKEEAALPELLYDDNNSSNDDDENLASATEDEEEEDDEDALTSSILLKGDVWSLGCTVLEMATAEKPCAVGFSIEQLKVGIIKGNAAPAPAIPMLMTKSGRHFCSLCLRGDSNRRPQSAELALHPFVVDVLVSC